MKGIVMEDDEEYVMEPIDLSKVSSELDEEAIIAWIEMMWNKEEIH